MPLLLAQHLVLLVNQLGDHVKVSAPMLERDLFTVDLSARFAKIENILSSVAYSQTWRNIRERSVAIVANMLPTQAPDARSQLSKEISKEIPDFGRFSAAFRQSGVVHPVNMGEVNNLLKQARESNPSRGGDIYYFAFDNNALRNRLYSQFLKPESFRGPRYNLVLAKQVRNELECRAPKIAFDFLDGLEGLLPFLSVKSALANQNRLADRLRLLALAEWNSMLSTRECDLFATGEERPNAPLDSDRIIIRTYEQFAAHPGRKVVLFSSDNEFVIQSSGRSNLIGQFVSYPAEINNTYEVSWEGLCRLLYQLAIVFARLDLELDNGETIRLYGVWQEKGVDDSDKERVRVTFPETLAGLRDAVVRNQTILSAAMAV